MGKKKEAEVMDDFVPEVSPVIVMKAEKAQTGLSSEELRQRNLTICDDIKKNYLELAQCLEEVYIERKWESWGYGGFKEYVQKELGIKYGKANYLRNIWHHFGKNEELLGKIEQVGWDKMKELTKVATDENVVEWVDKAKLLSADDLKKEVKSHLKAMVPNNVQDALENEAKVRGTPVENQLSSQTFQFNYDSKLAVMTAIEKVQKETGISASESLALICSDYMGSAGEGTDAVAHVLDMVKRYESVLSLKFVVLDVAENQLVHGKDTLEKMVREALGK